MSNVESAYQRLVAANPEPNIPLLVASTGTRIATQPKGTEPMTTRHAPEKLELHPSPTGGRRRGWLPAAASAAAVIAVIAVIPLVFNGDSEMASMTDAQIAAAFLAGEVDEPSALFSPGAVIEHRFLPTGDVDGWYAWRSAIGEANSDIQCIGEGEVTCTFTFQLEAAAHQGLGPYPFNSATFSFDGGLISRWADLSSPNDAAREVWNPFFDWLSPDLHAQMYQVTADGQIQPLFTETSLRLWELQMNEFITNLTS